MSHVDPNVDLAALARTQATIDPPKRRALRWIAPLALVLAFLVVLASTATDLFRGAIPVTVVRPTTIDDASSRATSARAVLLQAAGWVEPDPLPVHATALVPGVVREVLVQESSVVKSGDPVATLFDEELRFAHEGALAGLERAQAELARAMAEAEIAQAEYDAKILVTEQLATTQAELDGRLAAAQSREAAAQRATAQVSIAESELVVQEELAGAEAAGPRAVELARARIEEARAARESSIADAALARADAEAATARHERARAESQTRFAERARVEASKAARAGALAAVREAEIERDRSKLRLERAVVRAPSDGIVLERHVAPGEVLTNDAEGAWVCTLYQPEHLRIRVDVPQGDVSKLTLGGNAEILAESRANRPYTGEVIRIVQKADIQKVTLQVHVRVSDADALLRPEMLCQVRFLGSGGAPHGAAASATRVRIPTRLVDAQGKVWVVAASGRHATQRTLRRGATRDEWIEVEEGLDASDKLIDSGRERLSEGARISIDGGP